MLKIIVNFTSFLPRVKSISKIKFYSTIYALSSGSGKCGISVLRISGENAQQSLLKMTKKKIPSPKKAVLRYIYHPKTGEVMDKGLVLWFPAPHSFTGEDCVEFHVHGSNAVCKAMLESLGKLDGFSPAQPGEFTKRAFYNSKLDLTSVEELSDLIHAETEAQRKQAFRQMEGALHKLYKKWRELLIEARAYIEAYVDFSEDDNIDPEVVTRVREILRELLVEMKFHLNDSRKGERLKQGLNMVIAGKPNVGKSTFLNSLTQKPTAIVSPIAGTTRDVVKTSLDIGGYPVNISDTAGIHDTDDVIELEGVARAYREINSADFVIIIVDAVDFITDFKNTEAFEDNFQEHSQDSKFFKSNKLNVINSNNFSSNFIEKVIRKNLNDVLSFSKNDERFFRSSKENNLDWYQNNDYIVLLNKIDLLQEADRKCVENLVQYNSKVNFLSLKTAEGFDLVLNEIYRICKLLCGVDTESFKEVKEDLFDNEILYQNEKNVYRDDEILHKNKTDTFKNIEILQKNKADVFKNDGNWSHNTLDKVSKNNNYLDESNEKSIYREKIMKKSIHREKVMNQTKRKIILSEAPNLTSQRQRTHIETCLKHIRIILRESKEIQSENIRNNVKNGVNYSILGENNEKQPENIRNNVKNDVNYSILGENNEKQPENIRNNVRNSAKYSNNIENKLNNSDNNIENELTKSNNIDYKLENNANENELKFFHLENNLETSQFQSQLENCYYNTESLNTDKFSDLLSRDESLIFAAQHLGLAAIELGLVIGEISTENVLDKLFSTFCIGK